MSLSPCITIDVVQHTIAYTESGSQVKCSLWSLPVVCLYFHVKTLKSMKIETISPLKKMFIVWSYVDNNVRKKQHAFKNYILVDS